MTLRHGLLERIEIDHDGVDDALVSDLVLLSCLGFSGRIRMVGMRRDGVAFSKL